MRRALARWCVRLTLQRWNKALHCCRKCWIGERFGRMEQLEHRVQMLLGVFSAKGVLPLEFKPAHNAGDLLTQHLNELEEEAEVTGGLLQTPGDHFAKV
jgi:hypothetical protein